MKRVEEMSVESTLYSVSSEPPAARSRRSNERHVSVFRVGSMFVGTSRELCLVKNISTGGALVRAYCPLEIEQALLLEIKEGQPVAGRVIWLEGSDAGIQFDSPIEIVELLSAATEGRRQRMPRIEVDCVGFVREGAVAHRSRILNISQGGICAEVPNPLTVGANVTVSLIGLAPQQGIVRWSNSSRYGIAFNAVVGLPVLIDWLHRAKG